MAFQNLTISIQVLQMICVIDRIHLTSSETFSEYYLKKCLLFLTDSTESLSDAMCHCTGNIVGLCDINFIGLLIYERKVAIDYKPFRKLKPKNNFLK
jgi:hypothetical protein